jgi:RNA polymerase sigma-70 factor, ECF subfamily
MILNIEDIYIDIKKQLYTYIYKLSGDNYITEEIIQETFYKALEQIMYLDKELSQGWFFKVARNLYFDYLRKQKKVIVTEDIDQIMDKNSVSITVLNEIDRSIEHDNIQKILSLLGENYRRIIVLKEFNNFSYEKIAEEMGMNVNQVKVTLFRARKSFKKLYERSSNNEM